jgi:lamin tail-like protein
MVGRGRIAWAALVLLGALAASVVAAPAFGASQLVVSQVYGGGGNVGAPYTNDYVELFNRGQGLVDLTGMSLQYATATGTGTFGSNPVTALSGFLAPGQYYLVQQASGGVNGVPLPTPQAFGTVDMSATGGKVIIASTPTGLDCNGGSTPCSGSQLAQIVDLVGYDGANFFEGAAPAPTLSNTTAGLRADSGCTDTDNNGGDFLAGMPGPRNIVSPPHFCQLAVTVRSLDARPVTKGVLLRWRTGTEADLLGFHVYRSRRQSWRRITRSLIAAKGSVSGASYRFLDRTAMRRGVSYRYRIKALNRDGTASWFGPVRVT